MLLNFCAVRTCLKTRHDTKRFGQCERTEATLLDGATIKAADRIHHVLPPVFDAETQYGHELRDGRIVCVPLRCRARNPVSFTGLLS